MVNNEISIFTSGVHNVLNSKQIKKDAIKDSVNWITRNGRLELVSGYELEGQEGSSGKVYNQEFGYKVDGTKIQYRKLATKVQYYDGNAWVDIITGMNDPYCTFANYSSLSGSYTYVFNRDGIWKIVSANPASPLAMYNPSVNFKGYAFIDKGRSILWGQEKAPTALRGSKIDNQNTFYVSVVNEIIGTGNGTQKVFTGTLAFKSTYPFGTCFALQINTSPASVTATDNYLGVISGAGVTGTINYATGVFSLTFTTAPANGTSIRVSYQHEDSNSGGVTDFRKSATRIAGEGFYIPQDIGGDAIKTVIALDGVYYSLKETSAYRLAISADDLSIDNNLYRTDIGVASMFGAVSTGQGIIFINTANPQKPTLTILERNPIGTNIVANIKLPHFAFENYTFDTDLYMQTWDKYVLISTKKDSNTNNTILLCSLQDNTVDILNRNIQSFSRNGTTLYGGLSTSETTVKLFSSFSDNSSPITNYIKGKDDDFDTRKLKKQRYIVIEGDISQTQKLEVYMSIDNGEYSLLGTVLGNGAYVDLLQPKTIGSSLVGETIVGGEYGDTIYSYTAQFQIRTNKYQTRSIMYVAKDIGYVSVYNQMDKDILTYEERIASKYRQQQNISLDGTQTNLPNNIY